MKVRPEEVEGLVQTLRSEGPSLSRLEDALVEGIRLGLNVIEWDLGD